MSRASSSAICPRRGRSAGLLRLLRDREGMACEQARFTRLYRATLGDKAA